jgi:lipoprotein
MRAKYLITLLLGVLFLIGCSKQEEDNLTTTNNSQLIEFVRLNIEDKLPAERLGEWSYRGRILNPAQFLPEDIPQELRDANLFIDITKPPLPNAEYWSNARLRTIYRLLFEHAKKHANLLKVYAKIEEQAIVLPSYLTPLYGMAGESTITTTVQKIGENSYRYKWKENVFEVQFREREIVLSDSIPFRWMVLKKVE